MNTLAEHNQDSPSHDSPTRSSDASFAEAAQDMTRRLRALRSHLQFSDVEQLSLLPAARLCLALGDCYSFLVNALHRRQVLSDSIAVLMVLGHNCVEHEVYRADIGLEDPRLARFVRSPRKPKEVQNESLF